MNPIFNRYIYLCADIYSNILFSCRMVKDLMSANNIAQVKKLLRVLGQEFTLSQNQNSRKGGLIGLAATAIALSRVSPLLLIIVL